ncbi:hypothetical protein GBA52_013220 [Prunus armeniaca]|nr:hypothetical protein GBA52_013220 [Prunus armeniaca]
MMKKGLPGKAKISKDAKETVQECVSEFISFTTGEASGKCRREKRKTINGDDLLWAMTTLGFKEYVEPLKIYLHKFREIWRMRRLLEQEWLGSCCTLIIILMNIMIKGRGSSCSTCMHLG